MSESDNDESLRSMGGICIIFRMEHLCARPGSLARIPAAPISDQRPKTARAASHFKPHLEVRPSGCGSQRASCAKESGSGARAQLLRSTGRGDARTDQPSGRAVQLASSPAAPVVRSARLGCLCWNLQLIAPMQTLLQRRPTRKGRISDVRARVCVCVGQWATQSGR